MSSIYRKDDNHVDKPKRNTFDLSHHNNLTTVFGRLTPVLVQEVIPGDSFKIEPSFGLRFMPQVFPVQTRQRASMKFYYVRNRNLWKDWMDFIGKTKADLVSPYFLFDEDFAYFFRPSGLLDYMGVPIKASLPWGDSQRLKLNKPWNKGSDITYVPQGSVLTNNDNEPLATSIKKNIGIRWYDIGNNQSFRMSDVYGGIAGVSSDTIPAPNAESASSGIIGYSGLSLIPGQPYVSLLRRAFPIQAPLKITLDYTGKAYLIARTPDNEDILVKFTNGVLELASSEITLSYLDVSLEGTDQYQTKPTQISSIVGIIAAASFNVREFSVYTIANSSDSLYYCDLSLEYLPWASTINPDNKWIETHGRAKQTSFYYQD